MWSAAESYYMLPAVLHAQLVTGPNVHRMFYQPDLIILQAIALHADRTFKMQIFYGICHQPVGIKTTLSQRQYIVIPNGFLFCVHIIGPADSYHLEVWQEFL
jgi:hypothetical protein